MSSLTYDYDLNWISYEIQFSIVMVKRSWNFSCQNFNYWVDNRFIKHTYKHNNCRFQMSDLNAKFRWHLGLIIIQNTIHYNILKRSHMMGWWPLNWISCEIQLTCQCIEKGLYIWWFASVVGYIKPVTILNAKWWHLNLYWFYGIISLATKLKHLLSLVKNPINGLTVYIQMQLFLLKYIGICSNWLVNWVCAFDR